MVRLLAAATLIGLLGTGVAFAEMKDNSSHDASRRHQQWGFQDHHGNGRRCQGFHGERGTEPHQIPRL